MDLKQRVNSDFDQHQIRSAYHELEAACLWKSFNDFFDVLGQDVHVQNFSLSWRLRTE